MLISIDTSQLKSLNKRLSNWVFNGATKAIGKASKKIATKYKSNMREGKDGAGNLMWDVTDATMKAPIRYGSDPAIRGEVRSSRTPLYARGRTIDSIKSRKTAKGYEVGPTTSHGQKILAVNEKARTTKQGKFVQARNPLIVSDVQMDIIEDAILDDLDKILRGR